MEIYNSSNVPQIVHEFKLAFYKGNNLVYEDRPKCDRHILSIPSKGIHSITQVYDMDDIDNVLVGVTKIVLKYKTLKMRYRKFVLYEGPALYPDTGKKA
ncbi:hypothetical protein SDC9_148506 [bioreactor metagenome]|uniref:Uncharacterized protein n=1 Tax=bioreactor metagenome TaxID=1076179 RepID=A0A645EHR6_9ZZZZ